MHPIVDQGVYLIVGLAVIEREVWVWKHRFSLVLHYLSGKRYPIVLPKIRIEDPNPPASKVPYTNNAKRWGIWQLDRQFFPQENE